MRASQELQTYTQRLLQRRQNTLGTRAGEWDRVLADCGEEESLLLAYLCATLPRTDLGDYSPEFFREFVREALAAREMFPWCAALPESLFLRAVLAPRINTEELALCRGLFREQLEPRVRGLSLTEAILEVNRWCAEQATYRSTDLRTASPLQVYQCGWGRCGEESTFLVTALRSVGIAARQVYAPWWSHCDDNHAWVEAFDGRDWRYLGACEPEPLLDRGWFTHAAARAMMVHTRSFVQGSREEVAFLFPEVDPADWDLQEGVAYENLTARYGETKLLKVQVTDRAGRPVPGAAVRFSVMNMAAPREIALRTAGEEGRTCLRVGRGSLVLTAWDPSFPEERGEILVSPEQESVSVEVGESCLPEALDFLAPPDGSVTVLPLTESQRAARREDLDRAAALREKKGGKALPPLPEGDQGRIAASLTEKDRAVPLNPQVLEDGLEAFSWEGQVPPEAFVEGLLSPRIGWEVLTPWRKLLAGAFSSGERESFRENPRSLWGWVKDRAPWAASDYSALWGTPAGMLQANGATKAGQGMLFCAACRALGIPARLEDGIPQFWQGGSFHSLWGGEKGASLILAAPSGEAGAEGQNVSLSRWEPGEWRSVSVGEIPPGEERRLALCPGTYRLWTVSRMPNGNQLCLRRDFSLNAGETLREPLAFRQGNVRDMLERCPLPDFSLWDEEGRLGAGRELLGRRSVTLLVWLEVNREPTEHILNELREAAGDLEQAGCGLCFVTENREAWEDPTLGRALEVLPQAVLRTGDFPEAVPALARRLYLDPDRLPLVILADRQGEGLYGCCGYNVGTAALVLRLIAGWEAEHP